MHQGNLFFYTPAVYFQFVWPQDSIGWSRMMGCMISKELWQRGISDILCPSSKLTLNEWAQSFIIKLFEATYGRSGHIQKSHPA
jgi:hypothetical protein